MNNLRFLNSFKKIALLSKNQSSIASILMRSESSLALLRKKTGLAFSLCKKALQENNNDLKEAEKWLKEESAKHGWAKSVRLQDRKAAEGLLGIYIDEKGKNGIVLEVNCETDFVAKNQKFKELVSELTKKIASTPQINDNAKEEIKKYTIEKDNFEAYQNFIGEAVSQLGEKIKINKAYFFKNYCKDDDVKLVGYAHSSHGLNNVQDGVILGKYGTIVAFKQLPEKKQEEKMDKSSTDNVDDFEDEKPLTFEETSNLICKHIIGMKPKRLFKPKDEKEEKAEPEIDPETCRVKEHLPDSLFEQKFLYDEDKTVKDYLNLNNIDIVEFLRVEICVGENLE